MKSLTQKTIGLLVSLFTIGITLHAQQIGEIYQGGYIFHISEDGTQGLVAATEDLPGTYEWGCQGVIVNGADEASIGTGYQNTLDIVNQGCSTVNGGITAAQLALDAEINGYGDWYLPSKDELKEIYNTIGNGGSDGNIGGFEEFYYWSSSESDKNNALTNNFYSGNHLGVSKLNKYPVRVIRSVTFGQEENTEDETTATDDTADNYLDLPEGWSMFGYTCLDSVDAATGFSEIADQIEIVKDEWGLSYLPSWDFNALGGLHYSEGYQIKMKEAITNFQFCEAIVPEDGVTQADVDAAHAMYEGWCASDLDNDAICDADEVSGCMDETACNYVSAAEFDDGSCYNNDLGCGCDQPEAQEGYDCEGNEIITSYQIGDLAHGGMVFYVDETGQHGLVAAMEDIEGVFEWGCLGESVNGADGASIGTGYQNTLDIVNQGCSTENGGVTAAQAALDAEINSYSDWYLPSYDELREMYNTIGNGGSEGNIGGFGNNASSVTHHWYWSSSVNLYSSSNSSAWYVSFNNGNKITLNKNTTVRVRVIRAF